MERRAGNKKFLEVVEYGGVNPKKAERILSSPLARALFRSLLKEHRGETYYNQLWDAVIEGERFQRVNSPFFYLLYFVIRILYGLKGSKELLKAKEGKIHEPYIKRGFKLMMESIARYGLTCPQIFSAPVIIVWNLTNACNLHCIHCYQDARKRLRRELTTEEKKEVVDQMVEMGVPLLAFSGGEPLMAKDFYEIAEYAYSRGMRLFLASNGTLITRDVARKIKEAGIKYVEISIDSVDPEKHDRFRGVKGYWGKAIEGIKNAVREGLSVGLASVITQLNYPEVEDLYRLSADLGCGAFCYFNFIPTGRAKEIEEMDLDPYQREEVLRKLYRFLLEGKLTMVNTAPQYLRVCLESGGKAFPISHYSSGRGEAAKILGRYIGGCGAGRAYLAIEPDGKITPCVFMKSLVVGDLRKERLKDIWEKSEVFKTLRDRSKLQLNCKMCRFRDYCGGCRARAYNYFGDITAPDPGCLYNIEYWNRLHKEEEVMKAM